VRRIEGLEKLDSEICILLPGHVRWKSLWWFLLQSTDPVI